MVLGQDFRPDFDQRRRDAWAPVRERRKAVVSTLTQDTEAHRFDKVTYRDQVAATGRDQVADAVEQTRQWYAELSLDLGEDTQALACIGLFEALQTLSYEALERREGYDGFPANSSVAELQDGVRDPARFAQVWDGSFADAVRLTHDPFEATATTAYDLLYSSVAASLERERYALIHFPQAGDSL